LEQGIYEPSSASAAAAGGAGLAAAAAEAGPETRRHRLDRSAVAAYVPKE